MSTGQHCFQQGSFARNVAPLALGLLLWVALVSGGFLILLFYDRAAGPDAPKQGSWPAHTKLSRGHERFTLVMFVHPRCPCSSASITELAVLMARCPQLRAYVLFLRPSGFSQNWGRSALWKRAARIPGVTVGFDDCGRESKEFAAMTSGETRLYGPDGVLLFGGGITAGRGHEGDNQGLDKIQSLVVGQQSRTNSPTPVFGCSLHDDVCPNKRLVELWKE